MCKCRHPNLGVPAGKCPPIKEVRGSRGSPGYHHTNWMRLLPKKRGGLPTTKKTSGGNRRKRHVRISHPQTTTRGHKPHGGGAVHRCPGYKCEINNNVSGEFAFTYE